MRAVTGDSLACGTAEASSGRGVVGESLVAASETGEVTIPHRGSGEATADGDVNYPTGQLTGFTLAPDTQAGTGTWVAGFGFPVLAGDLVLLGIMHTGTVTGLTVSDSLGSFWSTVATATVSGSQLRIFKATAPTAGTLTFSLHWIGSGLIHFALGEWIVSGLLNNNVSRQATATGVSAAPAVSLTPAAFADMVSFVFVGVPFSETETLVSLSNVDVFSNVDPFGTQEGIAIGVHGLLGTPPESEPFVATYTGSVQWLAAAVAFRGKRQ